MRRAMVAWSQFKLSSRLRRFLGYEETLWTRKVSDQETRRLISALNPSYLSAFEISGQVWRDYGFGSYRSVDYPAFDICESVLNEYFDLVIAEHIFEHLLYPHKA